MKQNLKSVPHPTPAISIEGDEHSRKATLRMQQMKLLARITRELVCIDRIKTTQLEAIFEDARRTLGFTFFAVCLQQNRFSRIQLVCSGGSLKDNEAKSQLLQRAESLGSQVLEKKERLLMDRVDARKSGVGGEMCFGGFPLVTHHSLYGSVILAADSSKYFGDGNLEIIDAICAQLAIAFELDRLSLELGETRARETSIVECIADGFITVDADWRVTYLNARGAAILDDVFKNPEQIHGKVFWNLFPETVGTIIEENYRRALRESISVQFEVFYPPLNRWFDARAYPFKDGLAIHFLDITARKRAELSSLADKRVFERIAAGAPLSEILDILMRETEAQSTDGMICSILLWDEENGTLRHGAAPSLPEAYNRVIDGIAPGPDVGSCGTAAFQREPVFVRDIASDPRWAKFNELAAAHSLSTCCSTPIFSSGGKLLGTVAMYYRKPHNPSAHDCQLIERATQLAAIIIERKQADDLLRRNFHTFYSLIENAPFGVYVVDAQFRLRQVSAASQKVFANVRPLLGRDFSEVLRIVWPEPFASEAIGRFRHTLETGEPYVATNTVEKRHDVSAVESYDWRIERITLPEGQFGVVCYFYDLTEVKRSESALRESEERFRHLANHAPVMIWVTEPDGICSFLSESWYEFTGQTPADGLGFGWINAIHPDDRESTRESFVSANANQSTYWVEFRLRHRDGTYRWAIDAATPRRSPNGEFLGYIGFVIDITERKNAEDALARLTAISEKRKRLYETALSNTPDLVYVFDLDHRFTYANEALLSMWGRTWDESIGKNCLELGYEPWHAAMHGKEINEVVRTKKPIRGEVPFTGTLGRRIYDYIFVPVFGINGEVEAVAGTTRDVTERKQIEDELRESREKINQHADELEQTVAARTASLQETNQQMEVFTYTIAHDLRAPLRAQRAFAEILLDGWKDPLGETGRDYAGRIIAAAARLENLVNDLLVFSRISRTEMELSDLNLDEIVSEITMEMKPEIAATNGQVVVGEISATVFGHKATLKTALNNLISNALKFTRPGYPPEVRVWAEDGDHHVRLWIEDKGIGISPEYHDQIFGVFHRLHRAGDYPGTGVGLAIVQKSIERMQGNVGVESQEGNGSRFWIELKKAAKGL